MINQNELWRLRKRNVGDRHALQMLDYWCTVHDAYDEIKKMIREAALRDGTTTPIEDLEMLENEAHEMLENAECMYMTWYESTDEDWSDDVEPSAIALYSQIKKKNYAR